jgi:hypothetical protein
MKLRSRCERRVTLLTANQQLRKTQLQRLIKQFRVLRFPSRRGTIESIEYPADLLRCRFCKATAKSTVEFLNLGAAKFYMGKAAAGIQPELLTFDRLTRRFNRVIPELKVRRYFATVFICGQDTDALRVALSQRVVLSPSLFV